MSWDNLRDEEGARNATERAGRHKKLITNIITAIVLNGILLVFTYPYIKDALTKKPIEKPVHAERHPQPQPTFVQREEKQKPQKQNIITQTHVDAEIQSEPQRQIQPETEQVIAKPRSIRECMKPNNLIDDDVIKCTQGMIEKSW